MEIEVIFVRDTDETRSHIAAGWDATAECGRRPTLSLGWTLGARSAWLANLALCDACKRAYAARLGVPSYH